MDHSQPEEPPKNKKQYKVKVLKKQMRFSLPQAIVFVALFALIGGFALVKSFAAAPQPDVVGPIVDNTASTHSNDELLIKFKPGASLAHQQATLAHYKTNVKKDIPQIGVKLISVAPEAQDAVKEALSHNPAVQFAEYNAQAKLLDTTPNDYWWSSEWGELNTQTNKAWDTTQGSPSTVIAVVDTGADANQPDLQGAIVPGWNTLTNTSDTTDIYGHGTEVAGVSLARSNNTIGIASYCWKCSLMPVKVTSTSQDGNLNTFSDGIIWAADHGAKVINMSWSYQGTDYATLHDAITYAHNKGAVLVASAGNSADSTPGYPAAYPETIGVAGTTSNDVFWSWSNYGPSVKVAAPGCNLATAALLNGTAYSNSSSYSTFCGTSSSSPATAGIVGLLRSYAPALTNVQIEQALENSADPIANVYRDSTGTNITRAGVGVVYGRVNAYKAIQTISGVPLPPGDTTPPTASISSPANGAVVKGGVSVNVAASDNAAVNKVDLLVDGTAYATTTLSPYSFFLDTTKIANGTHTLVAKAYDTSGNVGTSSTVSITVSNTGDGVAPTVVITSPANGLSIKSLKKLNITATATDNVGVTSMEVYIDGTLKTSSTTGSISTTWTINRNLSNSTHIITVKAYDAAGNIGQSTVSVIK